MRMHVAVTDHRTFDSQAHSALDSQFVGIVSCHMFHGAVGCNSRKSIGPERTVFCQPSDDFQRKISSGHWFACNPRIRSKPVGFPRRERPKAGNGDLFFAGDDLFSVIAQTLELEKLRLLTTRPLSVFQ